MWCRSSISVKMYCGQRPSRKKVWRFSRSLIIPIRLLNTNNEGRLYIKIGQVMFKSGSRVGNYAGIKGTRFRVWKITEMFQSWDSADKRVPVCRTLEKVCSCSLPGGVSRLSRRERQLINTLLLFVLSPESILLSLLNIDGHTQQPQVDSRRQKYYQTQCRSFSRLEDGVRWCWGWC